MMYETFNESLDKSFNDEKGRLLLVLGNIDFMKVSLIQGPWHKF